MPFYHYIKKIVCTLLLAILLFNWCGYRMLTFYLESKVNAALQQKLDKDEYDHSELISIKIPSPNLPYYNSSKEFCNVNGEIEMSGVFYKFVKRRLYNDTLEFLCLPNKELMSLYSAKNDFFKRVNDLQQTNQEKKTQSHSSIPKTPIGEYYYESDHHAINNFLPSIHSKYISKNSSIISCFTAVPDKPPELI